MLRVFELKVSQYFGDIAFHYRDDDYYLSGNLELLKDGKTVTPHFTVSPTRIGLGTVLLERMLSVAAEHGLAVMWIDDPQYKELGGCGRFSDCGQAFADKFRQKRGIFPVYTLTINGKQRYANG